MAYLGGGTGESSVIWGVAFGILAVYAGDLLAKTFMVFGEGFVDPPSMAIAACSILPLFLFPKLGIDQPQNPLNIAIPAIIIVGGVVIGLYQERKYNTAEEKQKACCGGTLEKSN